MQVNKFSFIHEVYKVKTFGTTHLRHPPTTFKYPADIGGVRPSGKGARSSRNQSRWEESKASLGAQY
jgi:hypothetical protein